MSVLTNKVVLIVGEESEKVFFLRDEFKSRGVVVRTATCDVVISQTPDTEGLDLIIFNHIHEDDNCEGIQSILNGDISDLPVPVFALVNDESEDIQKVLAEGAADYITINEDIDSILQKMEAIFNEDNVFSGGVNIDITPPEANVKTKGVRVFVVEDDPLLRNLLSIRMTKSAFPFEFSQDGKDIVPTIKQFKPQVIILDLMLPGKSGFDVLAELKEDKDLKSIPVVVFSNRDGAEDRKKARDLGAVSFYVKAMTDLSELVETIESLAKR